MLSCHACLQVCQLVAKSNDPIAIPDIKDIAACTGQWPLALGHPLPPLTCQDQSHAHVCTSAMRTCAHDGAVVRSMARVCAHTRMPIHGAIDLQLTTRLLLSFVFWLGVTEGTVRNAAKDLLPHRKMLVPSDCTWYKMIE